MNIKGCSLYAVSFCNVNNNGNANNNNNASAAGGVSPDSVRWHTVRLIEPSHSTQKEGTSCGLALCPPQTVILTRPCGRGRETVHAWQPYCGRLFHARWRKRHILQNGHR